MSKLENLGGKNAFTEDSLARLVNSGKLKKLLGEDGYPLPNKKGRGKDQIPEDFIDTGKAYIDIYKEMKENPPSSQ